MSISAAPEQREPPPGGLGSRARVAAAVLLAGLAWSLLAIVADVVGIRAAGSGDPDLLRTSLTLDDVVVWTGSASGIAIVVTFLLWFHRAHRVARHRRPDPPRRRPSWAVASWFVPIAGLVVPFLATRDLWRAGGEEVEGDPRPRSAQVPRLVTWWWALYVSSLLVGLASGIVWPAAPEDHLARLQTAHALQLVSTLAGIPATVLAVAVVRRVTSRLER